MKKSNINKSFEENFGIIAAKHKYLNLLVSEQSCLENNKIVMIIVSLKMACKHCGKMIIQLMLSI